jgi:hypothetical protein
MEFPKKVRAIIIVEILGRPADHVKEALKLHVGQLKNSKEIEVLSESISEPKRLETEQEAYTCFAEIDLRTVSLYKMVEIILDYMPSSVEILEPTTLSFSTTEINGFLNDLTGRLHKYDELAKIAQMQTRQLAGKMEILQNMLEQKQQNEKNNQTVKKPREAKKSKKKS